VHKYVLAAALRLNESVSLRGIETIKGKLGRRSTVPRRAAAPSPSRDVNTPIGAAPRDALQNLPDVRRALESELADRSPDGRVPRAVMGRFLRLLFYFGEEWLKSTMPLLFPTDNDDLRRAAWRSHLGHDQGPVQELLTELHGCYSDDIALLAATEGGRDFQELYQERLADYLLVLYLWGGLPDDLLHQFWPSDRPRATPRHVVCG